MPITHKNGNILDTTCDILVHQVNGLGVMGAGLAKQIAERYPHVERAYKRFVQTDGATPEELLGACLLAPASDHLTIANVFGQARIGRQKRQTDYKALENALIAVTARAYAESKTVAIPHKLGCGLAGGDWDVVEPMIERIFEGVDVTIYHYTPGVRR